MKKGIIIIICIFALIFAVSLYYYANKQHAGSHKSEKDELEFRLELTPSEKNIQYTIITPLPIRYDSDWVQIIPPGFEEKLFIEKGNATYKIIESDHGLALEIIGKGDLILRCSDPSGDIHFDSLSMQDTTLTRPGDRMVGEFDYWVYSNLTIPIDINIYCYGRWGSGIYYDSHTSRVNGILSQNWSLISGTEEHENA